MSDRLTTRQFDLLALTVAATLATHLAHLPAWLSLSLALIVPLRVWTRRRGAPPVGVWIRLPLTAVLLALVIANFGNVFGREPGSVLGAGLLGLKLLETERVRDARVALGFAAFVLMSALLFAQSLPFTLAICAVLVLLLASLASLQPAPLPARKPLRAQLRIAAALLGAGLPLAAAAFVLVPRLGSPLWGAPGNDASARSGLSERMAPGEFGELLLDDTPAFRVDFGGAVPPPSQRYFRTIVLWDFDGTAWTREWRRGAREIEVLQEQGPTLDYRVTLEPTQRPWLPMLDLPLDAPTNARLGSDRVAVALASVAQAREYRGQSVTRYRLAPTLDGAMRARALALPDGFNPRTRALAERWRGEGRDDQAVVRAALDLFHASFSYTLSPPLLGRDSVDDFLFDTQKGFCEHYSSAFVFLMRAAGIPARVVTGYQGGWWNAASSYLLVRQSDAHAWAEVWLPQQGWLRVDPTAAVSPARIERGAAAAHEATGWMQADWLRELRNQLDVVNRLWSEGVIGFNALRQKGLLTTFGVPEANPGDLVLVLSAALGIAMLIATLWAMRGSAPTRGDALDRAWSRLRRRVEHAGFPAQPQHGPLDWLRQIRLRDPALADGLAPLVETYADLRYARAAPAPAEVDAFARRVRRHRLQGRVKKFTRRDGA
ncbi:DUF3488 and transglutaminase-like domain-containing protein [Dokdonella sp.]|uniref:transglutaminase family protein n=1 Tax=Dokdonella sp. TaxID=2291710 RepID=UPI001B0E54E6|nr:DUF3488 and transglutaminase-like domain-containing protein [Dokdonella sp.]MBO9662702.1 DUF3488 domain-containing transglutaminase family protein [Dokdonella sp.]